MLLLAFQPAKVAVASGTPGIPTAITLQIVPATLPSDNDTYASLMVALTSGTNVPSAAVNPTTVFLSSSEQDVVSVQKNATIPAGSDYVMANLTTTVTPGSATITASSPGLASATTSVKTDIPSGFPTAFAVFLAPSTVLARPNNQGTIIVELLDQRGEPTTSSAGITIELTSTNELVANVSRAGVELPPGELEVTDQYESSFITGTATITASASGFLAGSQILRVVGATPEQIKVNVNPNDLPTLTTGKLTISLTDSSGNPARATSPTVVYLASSDVAVATVPSSVIVPAGSMYVSTGIVTTNNTGTATITASSLDLTTGSATVQSYMPSKLPTTLSLQFGPQVVLADGTPYPTGVIELQASGTPAVNPGAATVVTLTSSDLQIGTVPITVTIPEGQSFATFSFSTTYLSGSTTMTASSSNLATAQASQTTYGPVPVAIVLTTLAQSRTLPANGGTYAALEVSLESGADSPAVSPSNLSVSLLSTSSGVVSVDTQVVIPAGSPSVITNLLTSTLQGTANITAIAPGYSSGAIGVSTLIPAPSVISMVVAPSQGLNSPVSVPPILSLQLQDGSGNPTRSAGDTIVLVTSSNPTLLKTPIYYTIPEGQDHINVVLPLVSNAVGTATITATSPGLSTATAIISVVAPVFSASVTAYPDTAVTGTANESTVASVNSYLTDNSTLIATVDYEGAPLPGVAISWSSTGGTVTPPTSKTSAAGTAASIFVPDTIGVATITAKLTSPLTPQGELVTVTINVVPNPATMSNTAKDLFYIAIIVVPIIVAVLAVYLFVALRKRRRKARDELEAGFELLT